MELDATIRNTCFSIPEFTNAPGGISNGITSGFRDEDVSISTSPIKKPGPITTGDGKRMATARGVVLVSGLGWARKRQALDDVGGLVSF
jgi:hypothetical protein